MNNQGTDNAASLPHLQRAADGGHLDAIIHVTIIPTFIIVLIAIAIMIMIIFRVINIIKQYQPHQQKMGVIVIEPQQLFFIVLNMIVNNIIKMIMTIRLETWLTTCMRTRGGGVICSCSRLPEWGSCHNHISLHIEDNHHHIQSHDDNDYDDGHKVEPVASMIPYMTCPGNHEWHYNFSNYRSSSLSS